MKKAKYLYSDTDRHGNRRWYFRPPGWKKTRIRHAEGSAAFRKEVTRLRNLWESGHRGGGDARHGTLAWIVNLYLGSADFRDLAVSTRTGRRNLLLRVAAAHGDVPCADLRPRDIAAMRDALRDNGTPAAARNMLQGLRACFGWACHDERRILETDPTAGVRTPRWKARKYDRWTLDDVRAFVAHHPKGSAPRAILALMLCTGQSIGDVRLLGRGAIRVYDGREFIHVERQKTGEATEVPVLDLLRRELGARWKMMLWVETRDGGAYSAKSLSQRFSAWARQAGLDGKSSHGLRVSVASILSEMGVSQNTIMAVLAHRSESESQGYIRDRENRLLTGPAMEQLGERISHLFESGKVGNK